jgi:hypothetical protein
MQNYICCLQNKEHFSFVYSLYVTARLLGNELSGSGIGASVGAEQYGKDMVELQNIVNQLYGNSKKPLVLAPGGFYDKQWFAQLLDVSGPNILDGMTHHIYNLGAGECFSVFTF